MRSTALAPRRIGLAPRQRHGERAKVAPAAFKREQTGGDGNENGGDEASSFSTGAKAMTSLALAALAALSPVLSPPPSLAATTAAPAVKYLTREEISTVELYKRASPSVVFVTALGERRDALTLQAENAPLGAGSGIAWDEDHVVTNYHVVKDAKDIRVTVPDPRGRRDGGGGGEFRARLVGADPDRDVAVLEVAAFADPSEEELEKLEEEKSKAERATSDGRGDRATLVPVASSPSPPPPPTLSLAVRKRPPLVPLKRGTSSGLEVGQTVFAIGNPFGLSSTLTKGILSGVGREIAGGITGRPLEDVLQSDAAINPGNSGGPLLDAAGQMIGINTAIYSSSGSSSGIGFAIPVDSVASSVTDVLEHGRVVHPVLGIALAPESDILGVKGVLVLEAREGLPAAEAGIRGTTRDRYGRVTYGDVIRKFGDAPVRSPNDLYRALEKASVGDEVSLSVLREGVEGELKVKVTLGASSSL